MATIPTVEEERLEELGSVLQFDLVLVDVMVVACNLSALRKDTQVRMRVSVHTCRV